MKKILLGSLIFVTSTTFALQDCESGGKDINLNNGDSTRTLTGLVTCRDRDTKKIEREMKYVKGVETWERFYYENGKPKSERGLNEKGNSEGIAKEFYENGKLSSECNYVNSDKHGVCKQFYENGKPKSTAFHVKDNVVTQLSYNEDGSLHDVECSEGSFSKQDRELCGYSGKGTPVTLYWRDKSTPYQKRTYAKGQIVATTEYDDKGAETKHQENGVTVTKWPNGKVKEERRANASGELDGAQKEFAETGEPTRVAIFDNGFLKDEKKFYLNGQMRSQTERSKNGEKIVSHEKEFWDSGKVHREWTTEDERLVGKQQAFREDGSIAFEENFVNGKREGLAKYYHDSGKQIAREVAYAADVVKHVKEWDEKGKLTADDEYLADGSKKRFLKK